MISTRAKVNCITLCLLLVIGGCWERKSDTPVPEVFTLADHDRIFFKGRELVTPYMKLDDTQSKSLDTPENREELDRGIFLLENAVDINPENWTAFWILGKGYQAKGDTRAACKAFGRAFAIERRNVDVAHEYMWECLKLDLLPEALEAAEHASRLDPNNPSTKSDLAMVYLLDEQLSKALIAIDQSLAIDPTDLIAKNVRERILEVRSGKRPQPLSLADLEAELDEELP